jgi:dihydroorotase
MLVEGAPADLVLIDPDTPWQITADAMRAKTGNTPFDGLPVQGKVRRLFKGGAEVFSG